MAEGGEIDDRVHRSAASEHPLSDSSGDFDVRGGARPRRPRNPPERYTGDLRDVDPAMLQRRRRRARAWDEPPADAAAPVPKPDRSDQEGFARPSPRRDTGRRRRITLQPGDLDTDDDLALPGRRTRWLSPQRVLQEIRRWEVSFSGQQSEDVEEFLSLLEEGRSMVSVRDRDLLKALPFCLKGMARVWYRAERDSLGDWEAAKAAFRERFSDPEYQIALREEIAARTQGPREPVRAYLSCMNGLFSRLSPPWTEQARVRYAHRNMLPPYRCMISRTDAMTMRDLEREAGYREHAMRAMDTYRPPPKPEASLCPGLAYRDPRPQQRQISYVLNSVPMRPSSSR